LLVEEVIIDAGEVVVSLYTPCKDVSDAPPVQLAPFQISDAVEFEDMFRLGAPAPRDRVNELDEAADVIYTMRPTVLFVGLGIVSVIPPTVAETTIVELLSIREAAIVWLVP
jgi:hypothetical protein